MKYRRPFAALAIALLALAAIPTTAAATEGAVFAGGCVFGLNVSFSPGIRNVPSAQSGTFSGSGTCVVNGEVAPMNFFGSFATNPLTTGFGCVSGVLHGSGTFVVDTNGFPSPNVQVTFVNTGGVISVLATKTGVFTGVGSLVQDGNDTVECATSPPLTSDHWLGAVAFEDPEPPQLPPT
jgi:hypothetical protein